MTRRILLVLAIAFLSWHCQTSKPEIQFPQTDLSQADLIPIPARMEASGEAFGLDQYTGIYTASQDEQMLMIAAYLAEHINSETGLRLPVNQEDPAGIERYIYLNSSGGNATVNPEGYSLTLKKDSVILSATHPEGIFRGVQTLRQLIPEGSNDTLAEHPIWPLAGGRIEDAPNFGFRGSMLDVARHFFSVEDVKKYIDLLAYYKINVLHLHLTDDQGWRIEVKSWPRLTEIGGQTEVGGGEGGFFTQEDYKEIVAYAARHYMTIIPEIDMPGHTNAASVAYPFLDGTGRPLKPYTGTRVGFSSFDTRKDTVYAFIDDVVREISAITPGPYFHIGGDESHSTKKSDYIYFVERVEDIVRKHGKTMIGWDEISQADISSESIAQFWDSEVNTRKALERGMKVILSPAKKTYLDMQYDTLSKHGLHWAAYIPVDTAYIWNPEAYVKEIPKGSILGVEAPLWSETISTISELEYLAFPRVIGHAELSWSPVDKHDWENYKVRLANQAPFLDRMEVNFYRSDRVDWKENPYTFRDIEKD